MGFQLSPSILSADFGKLQQEVELINGSAASFVHCDIMDGSFVPNISFGFPVLNSIARSAKKPLDIHLMIVNPSAYIDRFAALKPGIISIHYEAETHLNRTLTLIRSHGIRAGVVLNPHTPVTLLSEILEFTDVVLLMSVNPGFGGQAFIEGTYRKIAVLRKMISSAGLPVMIEVDGGVDKTNASKLAAEGADILVAGNSIFGQPDPSKAIDELLKS